VKYHYSETDISILQGSVAKRLRDSGIFNDHFIENLLLSLPVKEFWKSVTVWCALILFITRPDSVHSDFGAL